MAAQNVSFSKAWQIFILVLIFEKLWQKKVKMFRSGKS